MKKNLDGQQRSTRVFRNEYYHTAWKSTLSWLFLHIEALPTKQGTPTWPPRILPRCGCVHKHEPGDWTVLGGVGGPTETEQGTGHLARLQIEDDDGVNTSPGMYRYDRPVGIHAVCVVQKKAHVLLTRALILTRESRDSWEGVQVNKGAAQRRTVPCHQHFPRQPEAVGPYQESRTENTALISCTPSKSLGFRWSI